MKKTYSILAAALITAGALLTTACSGDDNDVIDDITPTTGTETIQFTATLAPLGEGTTRAITDDNCTTKWRKNEQIFIYYETTDGGHASTTATVDDVDSETGVATITATFAANAKHNGAAKFVYPATLATAEGDIDEYQLLHNQNGLLRTGLSTNISKKFDAATATGRISVADGTASVKGNIAMKNQVCICKFVLRFSDDGVNTAYELHGSTALTIAVGDGRTYTISSPFDDPYSSGTIGSQTVYRPFQSGDAIYVAMLPFESQNLTFSCGAYSMTTSGSLAAGKFYRNVPVTLVRAADFDLSAGSITAEDGDHIIQSGSSTDNSITIVDGATVTIEGVNTRGGITCLGTATIILVGTNTVEGIPAIQAGPTGTTLTISGNGSLTATGNGHNSAAIGTTKSGTCGNITISGGNITATGCSLAAGIGCGDNGTCGDITISGGNITATCDERGGGIGIGVRGTCGKITISGGTVTASGKGDGAGIGAGKSGTCGDITIANTANSVTAEKGTYALYSIGMGTNSSTCGTITIGGTVYYNGTDFQNGGDHVLATSPFVYPAQ